MNVGNIAFTSTLKYVDKGNNKIPDDAPDSDFPAGYRDAQKAIATDGRDDEFTLKATSHMSDEYPYRLWGKSQDNKDEDTSFPVREGDDLAKALPEYARAIQLVWRLGLSPNAPLSP